MDITMDFAAAQSTIFQALVKTTRSAAQTSAQDVSFHRSLDPNVGSRLDRQSSRLLSLTQRLLRRCSTLPDSTRFSLSDAESIDTSWRALIDVTDGLLERADACLDEFNGLINQPSTREGLTPPNKAHRSSRFGAQPRAHNIAKPQLHFDTKPSNDEKHPFKPILTVKPHAIVPLEESQATATNSFGRLQHQHPYASEIAEYDYPSFVHTEAEPQAYRPFDTTTAELVDTLDGVHNMLEELKKESVIAVDLEHHDIHSYAGIVCLMQISTRNRDWIIDTLKPWRQELHILNEVFADPSILKVLHGAHMDVLWLQRDFGLYLVGLFDTHHASRVLAYPGGSLAFLLKKFIDFDAQKQYQTADWRIRPLPREMYDYARSDTHFLLYIYDCIRNELITRTKPGITGEDLMLEVLRRSKETAMQRYDHSVYDVDRGLGRGGWFGLLQKSSVSLSKQQFAIFRRVHEWRDRIARQEDESPLQIMPNRALFDVAQTQPRDMPGLSSVWNPVPPTVRARSSEVLALVHEALVQAVHEPEFRETLSRISKELRTFPQSLPSESRDAESHEKVLNKQIPVESSRAEFSSFWGSISLADGGQTERERVVMFEAMPHDFGGQDLKATAQSAYEGATDPELSGKSQTTSVKSMGGKRKAQGLAEDAEGAAEGQHLTLHNDLDYDRAPRVVQKLQRRGDQTLAPSQASAGNVAQLTPHFDYSAQPTLIHDEGKPFAGLERAAESSLPFNLYAKGAKEAGVAVAKKSRKAGWGKSFTYK